MNKNTPIYKLSALFLGLFMFTLVAVPRLAAQEDNEDEVFDLSPFTITSEEDKGYAATNTLAGTRLRSDLKDLAGAVQVVTEEFLEDTSSTNIEDLFLYTTNTEVAGPDGNFGNGQKDRRDSNGSARVRGLAEPDRTRNFFLSDIGLDTYNLDRVTIAKGPNAILFGMGSPAGLVNSNLKQARYEDTTQIKLRYASWGAHREILDVNRVFIDDVLAFRIIGLNNQNKFKQKPSFEDEQRLYTAMLFDPFENTTIRANMEIGSRNASRPYTRTPSSNIPDWIDNGMQTSPDPGASNGFSNKPSNRGPLFVFDSPGATQSSTGFDAGPAVNGPDGIRRSAHTWKNRADDNAANVSNNVLSDEDNYVFDFRNNTLTGTENTSYNSFDATNITLEQQFSQNAGIEIAYTNEHYKDGWSDRASNDIKVDTSELHNYFLEVEEDGTPVDIPNPHLGRPYRSGNDTFANSASEREAFRVTGYYNLDFRDHDSLAWLGRHVFTGLYSDQSRQIYEESDSYGSVSGGEIERVLEANRGRSYSTASYDRLARNIRYLGPRMIGLPASGKTLATRTTANTPKMNEITAVMYDSTADPLFAGHKGAYREISAPLIINPVNNASIDRQEIESVAVTAQSYFLNDNIVGTYGWREDKGNSWRDDSPEFTSEAIALPDTLAFDSSPNDSVSDSVFTWGVVGHLPEDWRPFGLGLSAHYGESENFVPSPGRITLLNEPHPSPAGETKEYGFSIDLPEQDLYVRFNWYETVSKNQTDRALGTSAIPNYERLWYNAVRQALQEREPRDPTVPASEYETWATDDPRLWPNNMKWKETYVVPPLGMRQALWTPIDTGADAYGTVGSVSDRGNPNVMGVSDFQAEGMEVEGVWNPTSNWTMIFNVAQQKAIKTNVLKSYIKYYAIREPQWLKMSPDNQTGLLSRPNTYKRYDDLNGNGSPDPGEPSKANFIFNQTRATQWSKLLRETLREGALLDEVREWRANVVTNYDFDADSALRGWSVGGAFRWQDEVGVGFTNGILTPGDADLPAGLDTIAVSDVTQPLFGPTEQNLDLWVKHTRKIFNDKVDWRIQLNIRNALNNDDLIITNMSGDGLPSGIRIMNPINFRLTSTFSF